MLNGNILFLNLYSLTELKSSLAQKILVTDISVFQMLHLLNSWWNSWICQTNVIFSSEIQKDTSFDRLSGWHGFVYIPLAVGVSFSTSWWKEKRKRDVYVITHKCKIRWKQQKWDKVRNLSGIVKDSFLRSQKIFSYLW